MAKATTIYVCSHCDAQSPKWAGRCDVCGKWGTLSEGAPAAASPAASLPAASPAKSVPLCEIDRQEERDRIGTGDPEVNRVLGGGIVRGSVTLLSGEPGIGKSTLVAAIAADVGKALYVSGEESAPQLKSRFDRLGKDIGSVRFLEAYPIETIVATIEKEAPALAIVDSVQTLSSSEAEGAPGTPAMVRYASSRLMELAKRTDIPALLIGQVTKDGNVAGPKTLEHLVDAVLGLEGDPRTAYRILRASKNRFGATDEVGVFEMTGKGLVAVENPSERFLEERSSAPGSVIAAAMEGSRVFLVEVQALVDDSPFGTPVRRASGFDQRRLQMLCAILGKRAGVKLGDKDVYVNVIGGLTLREPAADLAVCAAILGAAKNEESPFPILYAGEVGLGGDVRSAPLLERRLKEAERMGLRNAVAGGKKKAQAGIDLRRVTHLREL